jgi:hypothetical protein
MVLMVRTSEQDLALGEAVGYAQAAVETGLGVEVVVQEIAGHLGQPFRRGDRVRIRKHRDLAGFEGIVVEVRDRAAEVDGRIIWVELTGAARGTWRYKPEWLEPL